MKLSILFLILCFFLTINCNEEQLLLVIEVTRHGAREPTTIFNFTTDPKKNFKSAENLTPFGKQQHFNLGKSLRSKYVNGRSFLSQNYTPSEVYVQATSTNRTYLSALYQLMGLYSESTPSPQDQDYYSIGSEEYLSISQQSGANNTSNNSFHVVQESIMQDYLLYLDEDNCPRYSLAQTLAKTSDEYEIAMDYFTDKFRSRLENITNTTIASYRQFYLVCSYFQWAGLANLTLKFNLTQKDKNYCQAIVDSKLYYVSYGLDELWKLGSYDFLNLLFKTSNDLKMAQRSSIQQKIKKHNTTLPKFMMYVAHAETLSKFMDGLGLHHPQKFDPASGIFLEFFKLNGQINVRFNYYESLSETFQTIKLIGNQDFIDIDSFLDIILTRLSKAGQYDIRFQCFQNDYSPFQSEYYSGQEVVDELLSIYNLQETSFSKA